MLLDGDLGRLIDRARVGAAVLDLELLGGGEAGLESDRDVVGDVVATQRQHRRMERRAVDEQRQVDRAGAEVGHRDTELTLGLGQHGVGGRQRCRNKLVDAHVRTLDALGQVLDRRRAAVDDVRLDLEPHRAHAQRILDALLAVDDEAARQDVQHLAIGWDLDGPGDLGRALDVLAA